MLCNPLVLCLCVAGTGCGNRDSGGEAEDVLEGAGDIRIRRDIKLYTIESRGVNVRLAFYLRVCISECMVGAEYVEIEV